MITENKAVAGTLTEKKIVADGFSTAYIESGDPARQTMLFLHDGGFGTTGELCWGPVMEELAADFHVIAPDLLGWGHTDKAVFLDRSPYARRIQHIAGFCEATGIESPIIIGASFGGSMVMRSLAGGGNCWNARAAVNFSGSGGPFRLRLEELGDYTPSLEEARRLTGMLVASLDGLDDHIQQRFENSLIPGHWESLMAPRLKNPSGKPAERVDPYFDLLAEVDVPVLLVEGESDTLLETGWSERLAALNPQIVNTVVPYAHEPNIEAPGATAELIRNFANKLEGKA
jgi:pimeloyl-ACP methyl ester carboxylesterase